MFDIIQTNDVENDKNVAVGGDENVEREIPSVLNEDISNFRAQGFAVDDDNEPAPENIPTSTDTDTDDMYRPWGSEPLDARRVSGWCQGCPAFLGKCRSIHAHRAAHLQDSGLQNTNQNLLLVHDRFLDRSCLYWYAHCKVLAE